MKRRELLKQIGATGALLCLTEPFRKATGQLAHASSDPAFADAITLAEAGKAHACIVTPASASISEQMAATELAHYLGLIAGAEFTIHSEDNFPDADTRIFVGPTSYASQLGIDAHSLGAEEWIIRTVGADILIVGGKPRGTLYAAYNFLEDVLGVHWWNPFEESVPTNPDLHIASLNLHSKPGLQYRDIYMLYGHDGGLFAARNRLNRDGDARIQEQYGGARDYGLPYHVHTFGAYFPPSQYFETHPEWYSLIDGKRTATNAQLCLTNTALRAEFLRKLRANITASRAAAGKAGITPPLVFSVSQNDCLNPCQCGPCQQIATAESSECGPLLHFVNYLADGIRQEYPEVFIDTLAYQYTQQAPKTVRPRNNVIVRLCNTNSDQTQPITAAVNTPFREQLQQWSKIAQNLRIWNYAVTYAAPIGLPMPSAQNFGPDFRYYASHHVEGVFTELEFEILADMRDFKVWVMAKQLESPNKAYAALVHTFTDGFYGPAGRYIRQYLSELQNAMLLDTAAHPSPGQWNGASLSYLKPLFVNRAHQLFDQAEKAAGTNAMLVRRVRHARLPLDRASVHLYLRLAADWQAAGRAANQMPPNRTDVARRAMNTWIEQAHLRLPAGAQEEEEFRAIADLRRYAMPADKASLPEKFRNLPTYSLFDYTAPMSRNADGTVKIVKDPEAETGLADKLDLTADYVELKEKYTLPMPWGLYGPANKTFAGSSAIKAQDIPGPGYHWYKMGEFAIAPSFYIYFFWSWIIQFDIENAYNPVNPTQKFEVWAKVKFTGRRFPYTRPNESDAIFVERAVLVKPP